MHQDFLTGWSIWHTGSLWGSWGDGKEKIILKLQVTGGDVRLLKPSRHSRSITKFGGCFDSELGFSFASSLFVLLLLGERGCSSAWFHCSLLLLLGYFCACQGVWAQPLLGSGSFRGGDLKVLWRDGQGWFYFSVMEL